MIHFWSLTLSACDDNVAMYMRCCIITFYRFLVANCGVLCAMHLLFRHYVYVRTWSVLLKISNTMVHCVNLICMTTR